MSQEPHLNPLSCTRCKVKKIRCDREIPTCSKCADLGTNCIYPKRQVRQVNKRYGGHMATDDTLNTILRRLERVERGTGLPSATSPQSGVPASLETTHIQSGPQRSRSSPFAISRDQSASAESDASHDGLSAIGNVLVTSPGLPERDTHAVLEEALRRVQDLNLQALSVETVTATIVVPLELAKTWIQRYFEMMTTDIFLGLVDRRVIELIPDMIGLPHIRLDPAILVVYYYILRIGCAMPVIDQEQTVHFPGIHYAKSMYICCLRALPNWQREAVGSATDLIAAIMMTRAASDALDPRLSAQMFQLVCKYAIGLGLHNTDSPDYPSSFGRDNIDEARRGFWELMHYEFFHRLVYDDPPAMTAQMKEWIVSLPCLESCERPVSQEVPTIKFILTSRLTFILAEFFLLLDKVPGHLDHESFAKVIALCQQIDDLYKDWDIDTLKARSIESQIHSWMLADLTLAGYICILFMLHRASLTTPESPQQISQLPMALSASRQVIKAGSELLKQCSHAVTICFLFGTYRIDVAYAYLVSSAMHTAESPMVLAELQLLEAFTRDMSDLVAEDKSCLPLLSALRILNSGIRLKLDKS